VFETGVRQLRLALAMVWGRPVQPSLVTRLVSDALATLAEFGEPGQDVAQLVEGPFADPAVRHDFTERALRRTARRLASRSAFYAQRFAEAGVDPRRLTVEALRGVPPTVKSDLLSRPRDLVCTGSVPAMSTRTTGSTGRPAEIWLSRYESELWPGLAALSGLLRDEIRPTDHMQVCISSRATAAVQQNVAVCRLVGARVRVLGLVPPDDALDALTGDAGPTLLATYPSYLALLVTAAHRRGLGPNDFRLRRVDVGGEVLSPALASATREAFGVPLVNDTFAMTEVLPVSGRTCGSGHLHHDLNTGLVEVLDVDSGEPAEPGQLGTTVITPYYPYRECMPVFRYDTRDIVRRLPDGQLDCALAAVPATSVILGKAGDLRYPSAPAPPVTARALVEALESLPTRPWPARYRAELLDGRLRLTVPHETVDGYGLAAVRAHLADRGLDADVSVVRLDDPSTLRLVRADLIETTFAGHRPEYPTPIPVGV
jgi:phenylacetate-coenzyme A ligase PaaK-like adenylate-forming protein